MKYSHEQKKRFRKILSLLLALAMILGPFRADTVFAAEEAVPVQADAEINTEESSDISTSENVISDNTLTEPDPAAKTSLSSDTSISEDTAVSENITVSVDLILSGDNVPSENTVSEDIPEAAGAAAGHGLADGVSANLTVMLYINGTDLEEGNFNATMNILEIMEGIDRAGLKTTPSVNFVFEGGGCATDERKRDTLPQLERLKTQNKMFKSWNYSKIEDRFKYLVNTISWNENKRWYISADQIYEAKNPVSSGAVNRLMTETDGNGVNVELEEFVESTMRAYPANQYALILWDHGSGPNGGVCVDDREQSDAKKSIMASDLALTLAEVRQNMSVSFNTFAFSLCDACLMGNLETATAWSPFTRYYFGSEETEPGEGLKYSNWVREVCLEKSSTFSDNDLMDAFTRDFSVRMAREYLEYYTGGDETVTYTIFDERKLYEITEPLEALSQKFYDKLLENPIDNYYHFLDARRNSIYFTEPSSGVADLKSFLEMISSVSQLSLSSDCAALIKELTLSDNNYGNGAIYYSNSAKSFGDIGGVSVYFPQTKFNEPYDDMGTIIDKDSTLKYKETYDTLENSGLIDSSLNMTNYRKFVKLYSAIHYTGNSLKNIIYQEETGSQKTALAGKLSQILTDYFDSDADSVKTSLENKNFLDTVWNNRIIKKDYLHLLSDNKGYYINYPGDNITAEGVNQQLIFRESDSEYLNQNSDAEYLLGFISAGDYTREKGDYRVDLINYTSDPNWFWVNGAPISVYNYEIDNEKSANDLFTRKVILTTVGQIDGKQALIDIKFDAGSDTGKITGYLEYYTNGSTGRYHEASELKSSTSIVFSSGTAEDLYGFKSYGYDNYPTIQRTSGTYDNCIITRGKNSSRIENGSIDSAYYIKDMYDSFYKIFKPETVYVNPLMVYSDGRKKGSIKKGSSVSSSDFILQFTASDGTPMNGTYTISTSSVPGVGLYYTDASGNCRMISDKPTVLEETTKIFLKEEELISENITRVSKDNDYYSAADGDVSFLINPDIPENTLLVVGDNVELSIKNVRDDMYYLPYSNTNYFNISDYISLSYEGTDITDFTEASFRYRLVSASGRELTDYFSDTKKLNDIHYKNYYPGEDGLSLEISAAFYSGKTSSVIKVVRQPVDIVANKDLIICRTEYAPTVYGDENDESICVYACNYSDGYYEDKNNNDGNYHVENYEKLDDITTSTNAALLTEGVNINVAKEYTDVISLSTASVRDDFNKCYILDRSYLHKLTVEQAAFVEFLSLETGDKIAENMLVPASDEGSVSDDFIPEGSVSPCEWYLKNGSSSPYPVFSRYESLAEDDRLISCNQSGSWRIEIPENAYNSNVTFYAAYPADIEVVEGYTSMNACVRPIKPVIYSGYSNVTTQSTKSGAHSIGLEVYNSKNRLLKEGLDYTVSYKNNKNAAAAIDGKKAPVLTVKGKGDSYKDMRFTVNYTILAADLSDASITLNRYYAPLTKNKKKGISLTAKVTLPGGKTVASGLYDLVFYETNDDGMENLITREELAELYTGYDPAYLLVKAKAKAPAANKTSNFITESMTEEGASAIGYPKKTKQLQVSLKDKKMTVSTEAINFDEEFLDLDNIKKIKAGRTVFSEKQLQEGLQEGTIYKDKNMTQYVGSEVTDCGVYYMAVSPTDDMQKTLLKSERYFFRPAAVKINITGTKAGSSAVKVDPAYRKICLDPDSANWRNTGSLSVCLLLSGYDGDKMVLTCTGADNSTVVKKYESYAPDDKNRYWYDVTDKSLSYQLRNNKDGYVGSYVSQLSQKGKEIGTGSLTVNDIINEAVGTYKIRVEHKGRFRGSYNISYKVKK